MYLSLLETTGCDLRAIEPLLAKQVKDLLFGYPLKKK